MCFYPQIATISYTRDWLWHEYYKQCTISRANKAGSYHKSKLATSLPTMKTIAFNENLSKLRKFHTNHNMDPTNDVTIGWDVTKYASSHYLKIISMPPIVNAINVFTDWIYLTALNHSFTWHKNFDLKYWHDESCKRIVYSMAACCPIYILSIKDHQRFW